jgi:hypothetical protein
MWKPGTEKPLGAGSLKQSPNQSTPTNGSAKKALSGSTMGMRFMQKRNQQQSPAPKKEEDKDNDDMKVDDDHAITDEATNSDMYGMQSDLIGRRSFGGFKPKVDNNWQDCRRYISGEDNEGTKKKHVSDDELLQRYKELVKGRSDHDKTSRTKKRKSSAGANSGGKRVKP